MTTAQMNAAIGQRVQWCVGDVLVDCTVTDVKQVWGNVRFQIEPVAGTGRQWVELTSLATAADSMVHHTGQALAR